MSKLKPLTIAAAVAAATMPFSHPWMDTQGKRLARRAIRPCRYCETDTDNKSGYCSAECFKCEEKAHE